MVDLYLVVTDAEGVQAVSQGGEISLLCYTHAYPSRSSLIPPVMFFFRASFGASRVLVSRPSYICGACSIHRCRCERLPR